MDIDFDQYSTEELERMAGIAPQTEQAAHAPAQQAAAGTVDYDSLSTEELERMAFGGAQAAQPQAQAQTAQTDPNAPQPLSDAEWAEVQKGVVQDGDTPLSNGVGSFMDSWFGQGRKDAMDNYRRETRDGGIAGTALGYLSDLGNSFWAGLIGGGGKIAEAAGHLTGSKGLVQGAKDFGAGVNEYMPTNMTDTAQRVDENGVPIERSWGQRIADEGKNVLRMAGEFAPAAIPGVGGAFTYANIGAGGVNRYNELVKDAMDHGLSKTQARIIGGVSGAIDVFSNAFLMGKFRGKGVPPIEEKYFKSFVGKMLAGAAKTAGVMGASGGSQDALQQMAENGEFDIERTGNAVLDSAIQGAMFHVMNEGLHAPIKWSAAKAKRAQDARMAEMDGAKAERANAARETEAEREARIAEDRAIESARQVLNDPLGTAKFIQQNQDIALDMIHERRRGRDVDTDALLADSVDGIPDALKPAFQTQQDANAFGDRLLEYYDNANAADRQRMSMAQGERVERGDTLENQQRAWDEESASRNADAERSRYDENVADADAYIKSNEKIGDSYNAWLEARGLSDSPDLRIAFAAEERGTGSGPRVGDDVRAGETRESNQDAQRVENMDNANRAERLVEADRGTYDAWLAWQGVKDTEGNRLQYLNFMNGGDYALDVTRGGVKFGKTGNGGVELDEFNRFYDEYTKTRPAGADSANGAEDEAIGGRTPRIEGGADARGQVGLKTDGELPTLPKNRIGMEEPAPVTETAPQNAEKRASDAPVAEAVNQPTETREAPTEAQTGDSAYQEWLSKQRGPNGETKADSDAMRMQYETYTKNLEASRNLMKNPASANAERGDGGYWIVGDDALRASSQLGVTLTRKGSRPAIFVKDSDVGKVMEKANGNSEFGKLTINGIEEVNAESPKAKRTAPNQGYSYEDYAGETGDDIGHAILRDGPKLNIPEGLMEYRRAVANWNKLKDKSSRPKPKMSDFGVTDPSADFINNLLDGASRADRIRLFGFKPAKGSNDGFAERLHDPALRAAFDRYAEQHGASAALEKFASDMLGAHERYGKWSSEKRTAEADRKAENEILNERMEDLLKAEKDENAEWDAALGEIESGEEGFGANGEYVIPFSRARLSQAKRGDIIRFGKDKAEFTLRGFDPESGVMEVVAEGEGATKPRFFEVSENGVKEVKNGRSEEKPVQNDDRDENGERRGQGDGGEGGEGGFQLESATPEQLEAERVRRQQREEIARRQAQPIKGGGEYGQTLMDLGGAEGEDLFNRTTPARNEAPAKPETDVKALGAAAKKAMQELRSMGAVDDKTLASYSRQWRRQKGDRFQKMADAADTVLKYREAVKNRPPSEGGAFRGKAEDGNDTRYSRTVDEAAKEDPSVIDRIANRLGKLIPGVKVKIAEMTPEEREAGAVASYDRRNATATFSPDANLSDVVHEIGGHAVRQWAERNSPELLRKAVEYARNAPKEIKDYVYRNYADRNADGSFRYDGDALLDEIFAHRFAREHGEEFRRMLNEKPKARKWWANISNAVRSVFQSVAKRNGVGTEKLRGLDADAYMKGVAEQLVAGKEMNEWTAFGRDMRYFGKANDVGASAQDDKRNARRTFKELKSEDSEYAESVRRGMAEDPDIRYSRITDKDEIERLNKGKTIKMLASVQDNDGVIRSPMAAKIGGKLTDGFEIGAWYKSDEHPELATKNGKFKLIKGDGDGGVDAAYNPYWHSTSSPLNDQFSTAYRRPELRTVEVEIPVDDVQSGYWAKNAKNPVGEHEWKGGPLSNELKKYGIPQRKLMLSTTRKITRVVPTSEVADRIEEFLGGKKVEIPVQTMNPELRAEMMRRGFRIGPPKGLNQNQLETLKRSISDETLEKLYRGEIVDNDGNPMRDGEKMYSRRGDEREDVRVTRSGNTITFGRRANEKENGMHDGGRREGGRTGEGGSPDRLSFVERTSYRPNRIHDLFRSLNSDADSSALAERVFAAADSLGARFGFGDIRKVSSNESSVGAERMGRALYDSDYFSRGDVPDQVKADKLLHEAIHSVTSYALSITDNGHALSDVGRVNAKLREATDDLRDVYSQARERLGDAYGAKNEYEFVAELSNPSFRGDLKKIGVWDRTVGAVKKIIDSVLGTNLSRTNANDAAMKALDKILENGDQEAFDTARRFAADRNPAAEREFGNADGEKMYSRRAEEDRELRDLISFKPGDVKISRKEIDNGYKQAGIRSGVLARRIEALLGNDEGGRPRVGSGDAGGARQARELAGVQGEGRTNEGALERILRGVSAPLGKWRTDPEMGLRSLTSPFPDGEMSKIGGESEVFYDKKHGDVLKLRNLDSFEGIRLPHIPRYANDFNFFFGKFSPISIDSFGVTKYGDGVKGTPNEIIRQKYAEFRDGSWEEALVKIHEDLSRRFPGMKWLGNEIAQIGNKRISDLHSDNLGIDVRTGKPFVRDCNIDSAGDYSYETERSPTMYSRRADSAKGPYDERTEDGRRFNEKYAGVGNSGTGFGRAAADRLGAVGRDLDAALSARRENAGEAESPLLRYSRTRVGSREDMERDIKAHEKMRFGTGKTRESGMESLAVVRDGDSVYKYRDEKAGIENVYFNAARHNEMFGDRTPYEIVDYAEGGDGNIVVLKQPYVDIMPKSGNLARKQLEADLRRRFGDVEVSRSGNEMRAGGWVIDDLKDANIGIDSKTGRYAVVDAIVRRNEDFPGGKPPKMDAEYDLGAKGEGTVLREGSAEYDEMSRRGDAAWDEFRKTRGANNGAVDADGDVMYSRRAPRSANSPKSVDEKESFGTKFRRAVQDNMIGWRNFQDETGGVNDVVDRNTGHTDFRKSTDFYEAKDRQNGYEEKDMRALQNTRDRIDEALVDAGVSNEDFGKFLALRHAEERNRAIAKKNGVAFTMDYADGAGISSNRANQMLNAMRADPTKFAALDKAGNEYDAMMRADLDRRLASGRISQDDYNNLSQYRHYAPLRRDQSSDSLGMFNSSTGGMKKNEFIGAKGLGADKLFDQNGNLTVNPYEFGLVQAQEGVKGSLENESRLVLRNLVEHANANGNTIGEIVDGRAMPRGAGYTFEFGNGDRVVADSGYNIAGNRRDVVLFKDGGQLKAIRFDAGENGNGLRLADAANGKDMAKWHKALEWIPKMTRTMAAMRTQYVPTFIARNFKADTLEAMTAALGRFGVKDTAAIAKDMVKAEVSNAKDLKAYIKDGTLNGYVKEAVEGGLLTKGGTASQGFDDMVSEIKSHRAKLEREKTAWYRRGTVGNAKQLLSTLGETISFMNEFAENSTRIGMFTALRRRGVPVNEAVKFCRDATTNFNRHGWLTPYINGAFMFSNAATQGMTRNFQAVKDVHGRQLVGTLIALGTAEALVNHYFGNDEDREKDGKGNARNLSEYEKKHQIGIPLGGGKQAIWQTRGLYATIPYLARTAVDAMLGETKVSDAMMNVLSEAGDVLTEPLSGNGVSSKATAMQSISPTIVDPLVQWVSGKDYKGDDRIAKSFDQNKPLSWNGKGKTSEGYKWFAKLLNSATGGNEGRKGLVDMAPEDVQLIVETLVGGVGRDISQIGSGVQTARQLANGEAPERVLGETAFARDWVREYPKAGSRYYSAVDRLAAMKTELASKKTYAEKSAFVRDNPLAATNRMKAMEKMEKSIRDYQALGRGMSKDKSGRYVENASISAESKKRYNDLAAKMMARFVKEVEKEG